MNHMQGKLRNFPEQLGEEAAAMWAAESQRDTGTGMQ